MLDLHQNDGLELVLLLKGEVSWQIRNKNFVIQPGSLFFSLPSEIHGGPGIDHAGVELLFVIFKVEEQFTSGGKKKIQFPAHSGLPNSFQDSLSLALVSSEIRQLLATDLMKSAFIELVNGLESNSLSEFRKQCLEFILLEELHQGISNPKEVPVKESLTRIRTFFRELKSRSGEEWTVEKMASACGLGRSQFTEKVRKLYGHSPNKLLTRIRLEKAKKMLQIPGCQITAVAFQCGFNSSQYFATVFKEFYGVTPSQYVSKNHSENR